MNQIEARLEFRDITIVDDEATGETILEIELRGKRGVGYCKSMSGAVLPFKRLRERPRLKPSTSPGEKPAHVLPGPTDLLFPLFGHRELFNTILNEQNLKRDRDGQPRTAYSLRHLHLPAADGGGGYLPGREELPHKR